MSSFNKVILMGNLTRDPELRVTTSGTAIVGFGLAVNRNWRNESGGIQEEVTFVEISAFGKQAETIDRYLKRGNPILVEGRLRQDQWVDKQTGQKRSQLKIVLENFRFLPSGGQSREGGSSDSSSFSRHSAPTPPASQPPPQSQPPPTNSGAPPEEDDDVPF